ncbi:nucleotidyltransferase domain-containing protein [Candidatus Nanohalobium constans]|uniref:Putative nucleotidyltransferase n=1 Tax=Candidatus Nanohalobium constans TaxID=2565781 RepID=A0A5Q0UGQ5_9ARCH|nr:nucleotidyltransferase domain-containing protein [Candidatus Nanohalobium constans]QGA80808.1 putative nucleotidyltransferase [Candidatus Nanohalobium constans]
MSKQREAFEEIEETVAEELGDSLKKLILFGSVARDEEDGDSDLDLFVVVENENQKRWVEQEAAEIGVEYGVVASAIVKTEDQFENMKNTLFGKEVLETGETYV